jgi:hypothetical protein
LRKDMGGYERMHHEPLPKKLRALFDHYEASYYEFVVSLTKPEPLTEELLLSLMKFRIYKNAFYSALLKHSHDGLITYIDHGEHHFNIAKQSRMNLLDLFPEHAGQLEKAMEVPAAFLPFIKMAEDPYTEVLGQTLKLDRERSLITIRSGTGKELPTSMHEHLHAAVRGLPGVFEEGFCRYALQSRGIEPDEMIVLAGHDREMIRANFSGIYYPNVLVNILAQAIGPKQVTDIFFSQDAGELDAFLRRMIGKGFAELELPFRANLPDQAITIVKSMGEAFGRGISNEMKRVIDIVAAAGSAGPGG